MKEENIDIIEKYLSGGLDDKERSNFENRMKEDKSFDAEVSVQELVHQGLEEIGIREFIETVQSTEEKLDQRGFFSDEAEKDLIKGIEQKGLQSFEHSLKDIESKLENENFFEKQTDKTLDTKSNIISLSRRQVLSIAASLVLIVSFAWLLWPASQNIDSIYNNHYASIPEDISTEIEIERSEIGFSEDTGEQLDNLEATLKLYQNKSYAGFIESSKAFLTAESLLHYRESLLFYRAISYMELGDFENAVDSFEKIEQTSNEIKWNLALSYLRIDQVEKAQNILLEIDYLDSDDQAKLNSLINAIE